MIDSPIKNNPFKNYWAIASIKFIAIVGFEPRISGVGSNCYTNCATTQPKLNNICFLTILDNLAFTASFDPWVFMPLDQTQSPLECPNILLPSREISLTRATIEKKYIDFFLLVLGSSYSVVNLINDLRS